MMNRRKNRPTRWRKPLALLALCACLPLCFSAPAAAGAEGGGEWSGRVLSSSDADVPRATASDADVPRATASNAAAMLTRVGSDDLWNGWIGDYSFLSGETGNGTKEKPYQIATKAQLMGLSELAVCDMTVPEGKSCAGDYTGAYFELAKNIDLGGMTWLPIGFYKNLTEMSGGRIHPFSGHFDGKKKTVSNFRMYAPDWNYVGFFGAVENAEIVNLILKPGNLITAKESAGILAGTAVKSTIRDITVIGNLRTSGTAGGVVGEVSDKTILENCVADHVTIDAGMEKETYVGGIAGKAADSVLADCTVNTGNGPSSRIQGGGCVGGIVGFQNFSNVYHTHVMGTIGGSGSQAIGGITGKYAGGKMKVARFEGTIAPSGLGNMSREGSFIGTHDTGFGFHYGTGSGADVAYLFADTAEKISAGVCGSTVAEDNQFSYDAHIGFWHGDDNFYTSVQGNRQRPEDNQFFYEELEQGILDVMDVDDDAKQMTYRLDHFAPNAVGRPTRGYLISVLQIDTSAGGQNHYDVASLEVKGSSAYCHTLDKSRRGAVAAGDLVTAVTAPKNTAEEKFQMEGLPTYTDEDGARLPMAYQKGGAYTFRMPEHDTEIQAVYRKVAADVRVAPEEILFQVVQERSGNRKRPETVTQVRDKSGKLIARYINGKLEQGTKVQDVNVAAVVDANNDVADCRVTWSVDDGELVALKKNDDEDSEGYTEKSASLELNLDAGFFKEIIEEQEKRQAAQQFRYRIPDTIYGEGSGGVAVLTARTRASASFEGKPLAANCKILVTFQIKDRTQTAVEKTALDRSGLNFKITRTLSGNRADPDETLSVTEPQPLTATFFPEDFDKKEVRWEVSDDAVLQIAAGEYVLPRPEGSTSDYKNASVRADKAAKWIQDIIAADRGLHELDPYTVQTGHGLKKEKVTIAAEDVMGNQSSAECPVTVEFQTVDRTVIVPEDIRLNREQVRYELVYEKAGDSHSVTTGKTGFVKTRLSAQILPALEEKAQYAPYDRDVMWISSAPEALRVDSDGTLRPVEDADWIKQAMRQAPYTGKKTVTVTAIPKGNQKIKAECTVELNFSTKCLEISEDQISFDLVLTRTGYRKNPATVWTGNEGKKLTAALYAGSGEETAWRWDAELFGLKEGMLSVNTDHAQVQEILKKFPYEGQIKSVIYAENAAQSLADACEVLVNVKGIDKTFSSGSGGGSSGGGGGSSSSGITTSGSTQKVINKPAGSVTGTWVRDGAGSWLFTSGGRTYADEWAFIHNPYAADGQESTTWFRFDEAGHMKTGWYQDASSGDWYYLHAASDGTLGRMYTCWNRIGENWYYFHPMSDGGLGRMYTGWNWIDGKCYFFDNSGKMITNGVIDGYSVNENGEWTENGAVRLRPEMERI